MINWKDIIEKNDINEIQNLIDTGADVNEPDENGFTPLMIAANGRNPETVKALIKAGANVNSVFKYGETPLMQAVRGWCANPEIVKILLNAGANVNVADEHGKTPLMYATEGLFIEPETVKILLKAGRRANAANNSGSGEQNGGEKKTFPEKMKPVFDLIASIKTKSAEKFSIFFLSAKRTYADKIRPFYQSRPKTCVFGLALLAVLAGYGINSYMNSYTATRGLNCRDEPGTHGQVIGKIVKGKKVSCSAYKGEWCETRCGKEKGFVYKKYLSK